MQKIIVTGGLGFIGSNLIKLLLKDGYFVINVDKISYASNFYNVKDFKMPSKCPVCNSDVKRQDGKAAFVCMGGLSCSAQKNQAILHFASRKAMNIDGLGEKIVLQLTEKELVNDISDLFLLLRRYPFGLQNIFYQSRRKISKKVIGNGFWRDATVGIQGAATFILLNPVSQASLSWHRAKAWTATVRVLKRKQSAQNACDPTLTKTKQSASTATADTSERG